MNSLKLAAASASVVFAACTSSVAEDVAYCVRTDDTSFEVRSALTPKAPTVLYTSEITKISPAEPKLSGRAVPTEINEIYETNFAGGPKTYSFTADVEKGICEVGVIDIDQYTLKPATP